MMDSSKTTHFKHGCIWEGHGFDIISDWEGDLWHENDVCKHCHSKKVVPPLNTYSKETINYVVPFVIVAKNEGGSNSTGVCLDCVLEAAKYMGKL